MLCFAIAAVYLVYTPYACRFLAGSDGRGVEGGQQLRDAIDAQLAQLYGLRRAEFAHILGGVPAGLCGGWGGAGEEGRDRRANASGLSRQLCSPAIDACLQRCVERMADRTAEVSGRLQIFNCRR